jgi:hypothetical protein
MNPIDFQAKLLACAAVALLFLILMIVPPHADSFYPACLKRDGDWLHGVSRKECIGRDVRGRWYTNRVLKKARRVM